MKSIGSTGAQWRASLRQPNNRKNSISKRLAVLNQRGMGHRRTFVFHGSKNKTPGSYRQQNSCDFASLGASLTSEMTPSRGGDSIVKLAKRQSTKAKKDDGGFRKSSVELIGVTPPQMQEIQEVSPELPAPPVTDENEIDEETDIIDPYVNTRKFLENYNEMVFRCNDSVAEEPENVENVEDNAVEVDSALKPNTAENVETLSESIGVDNHATSNSLSGHESPFNEKSPAIVEAGGTVDSAPKSADQTLIPEAPNSLLEKIAMVTGSVASPTDPASPHHTHTEPEQKAAKSKTFSRKRRSGRKPVKKSIFQTDSQSEDDSAHVRYRKLFYSEPENKWVQHLILEKDEEEPITQSKCKDEKEKFELPHLVKGRQTQKFKQWLPTTFIKTERNKCFYDRIHVTDELRMELHKRKMPVVGSYFQEHIFKFGKLPFRGNPRPH